LTIEKPLVKCWYLALVLALVLRKSIGVVQESIKKILETYWKCVDFSVGSGVGLDVGLGVGLAEKHIKC